MVCVKNPSFADKGQTLLSLTEKPSSLGSHPLTYHTVPLIYGIDQSSLLLPSCELLITYKQKHLCCYSNKMMSEEWVI